jgi:hypothetical protein
MADKTSELSEGKSVIVEHMQKLNLLLDRFMQKDITLTELRTHNTGLNIRLNSGSAYYLHPESFVFPFAT